MKKNILFLYFKIMFTKKIITNVEKEKFRKDIQVLRGLAVTSAMFFHFNSKLFENGYIGVDIFFVISGFLISNIIYSEITNNKFKLKNFFVRRIKRIIPSLFSVLIFANILSYFVLDGEKVLSTFKNSFAALFFVVNILFSRVNSYLDGEIEFNLIINLWSLSIEEQFYIIFPFFILLLFKLRIKKHHLVILIIFVFSLFSKTEIFYNNLDFLNRIFFSFKSYIFYSPTVRVFEFMFGVAAMLFRFSNESKVLTLSSKYRNILFLALSILIFINIDIENTLLILISCSITSLLLISDEKIEKYSFSNIKILENIGLISYSLYLFHQPILAGIKNHNMNTTLYGKYHLDLNNLFLIVFIFLIIFLVSYLNFIFIEDRFRKDIFFKKNYKAFFTYSIILFALIGGIIQNTGGYDFRFKRLYMPSHELNFEFKYGTNYIQENNNLCINKDYIEATCKFNQGDDNIKIYLIGNSQLSSLTAGFLQKKYQNQYSIIEYTRQGCSLRYKECDFYPGSLKYDELYDIEDSIIILDSYAELNLLKYEITKNNGQLIIDSGKMTESQKEEKVKHLKLTVERLGEKNNKIIILEPLPKPFINLKMFEFVNNETLDLNYNSWKAYKNNALEIYNQIDHNNFSTISVDSAFCQNKKCRFYSDEAYFFIDDAHLSYYGANLVADLIIENINKGIITKN